jgi:tRNA(fMet)-specific endonuclease VapC
MSGNCLLDTNIIIALMDGDRKVRLQTKSRSLYIPVIVIGELYYGAISSNRPQVSQKKLDAFLESITAIDCDSGTAWHFGHVKSQLRAKGRMIPDNDVWIAALSHQYDLTLVSRDQHFAEIDPLAWEQW